MRVDADFEALYVTSFPRVVAQLAPLAGSIAEAEDLVQEAFARAYTRWAQVQDYDNPEAWVRTVASRLAISRWRRAKVAAAALVKIGHSHSEDRSSASDARLDVTKALATLPARQRQIVVLHHIADMEVAAIAAMLSMPVGSVKSNLSRGRRRLAAVLGEGVELPDVLSLDDAVSVLSGDDVVELPAVVAVQAAETGRAPLSGEAC
ncbi:MAG: polymerase, sigma-24 subunit, subfamily [Frankiales bacterium]|nr:polymerase, sigma-24 subunit, subfamily [Frankiales bacterium]